jgi:tetratricopeptide (TPR) repeat protein
MIIIEEDDVDQEINRRQRSEDFEKEELTAEECGYRNAKELMESVDCVVRYEQGVKSLQRGAELFQKLGDYRDSRQRVQQCERMAQELEETGREKAYREAVALCENAVTKTDYRTAISELNRFPEYKDCGERIRSCEQSLTRLANRQAWRNRGITAGILVLLFLAAWISPLKPYAKGIYHMRNGRYRLAVADFKEAGDFLNSISERKKCRYYQAQKAYDRGDKDRAAVLCRLAKGRSEADKLLAQIEVEQLGSSRSGDVVQFGSRKWLVLSSRGDGRLLLYNDVSRDKVYAKHKENPDLTWSDSYIRKWCNRDYKTLLFNQSERKLLQEVAADSSGDKTDKLYFFSVQEYREYADRIQKADAQGDIWKTERWWLKDLDKSSPYGDDSGKRQAGQIYWNGCTVDAGGEMTAAPVDEKYAVRPVIQITLDAGLLEDADNTAEK